MNCLISETSRGMVTGDADEVRWEELAVDDFPNEIVWIGLGFLPGEALMYT